MHPFICIACGKGFKYEHSLNFHIKSYHGPASNSSGAGSTSSSSNNLQQSKKLNNVTPSSKILASPIHNNHNQRCSDIVSEEGKSDHSGNDHLNENGMVSESEDDISLNLTTINNNNNNNVKNYHSVDCTPLKSPGSSSGGLDFGLPAMFGDKGIKIKSEKAVITKLEGIHTASDQTYVIFKCCLCGFGFPSLEPMIAHVQSMHSSSCSSSLPTSGGNYSCDKCGATFKWRSELTLHDQLHKAMDQQQGNLNGPLTPIPPTSPTSTASAIVNSSSKPNVSILQMSPFLSPNFMLLNPFNFNSEKLTTDHFLLPSNNCNNNNNNNNHSPRGSMSSLLKVHHHPEKNGLDSGQVLNLSMGGVSCSNSAASSSTLVTNIMKNVIDVKDGRTESSSSLKHVKSHHHHNNNGLGNNSLVASLKSSPDRLSLLNDELTKQLMQQNTVVPGNSSLAIGEIEETAPGQFKCRYCDKTFDRIFSVHRHERVHTGYKPCICKVCGRGFSEKRNLRHHIIRFHSDGSGRELLKRARKDKTLAATTKQLAASVMKNTSSSLSAMCDSINESNKKHSHEQGNNDNFSYSHSSTMDHNNESCVDLRSVKREEVDHRREEMDQEETAEGEGGIKNMTVQERRREGIIASYSTPPPSTACESTSPRNQNENEDQDGSIDGDKSHHRRRSGHHHHDDGSLSETTVVLNGKRHHDDEEEEEGYDESEERITASPSSLVQVPSSFLFSSSRRRKSKPSKKVFVANHDEDDEEEGMIGDDLPRLDEDDLEVEEERDEEEQDCSSRLRVVEDEDDERMRMEVEEGVQSKSNRSEDGNLSCSDSNSISGNHSENSLEGTSSNNSAMVRNHGAFFSSYSPRFVHHPALV